MQKNAMTVEGEAALRKELNHLIKVVRPGIIEAIATAREHGDLKENAEYHARVSSRVLLKVVFKMSKANYQTHRLLIYPRCLRVTV